MASRDITERYLKLKKAVTHYRRQYHVFDHEEIPESARDSLMRELVELESAYPELATPLPSCRFYRATQITVPGMPQNLEEGLATKVTLTGVVGGKVRVDYINQFGPTDAWQTLDTAVMTNTSQPYFDFTMFHQPARLYRLVQVP